MIFRAPQKPLDRVLPGLLFLVSTFLALIFATLDPYLHIWDEQFHALVAKNMASRPFKPMLYKTLLREHELTNWTDAHVWLHKQPFFLWLMALSIKLAGPSTLAVRLPSVLLHGAMAPLIYRIGVLTSGRKTGLIAALFFSFAYYPLELVTGFYLTDHNDLCFIALATASFWAWFEYEREPAWKWVLLIGLFAGCAILTKWLIGLLVFGGWAVSILVSRSWQEWKPWAAALLVCGIIVLPWQLWIIIQFPEIAFHEYQLNSRHLFEVVEKHSGDALFHWNALRKLYGKGDLIPILVLLSTVVFLWHLPSLKQRTFIISSVVATYLVFTLAATKMTSFTLVVGAFIFLALGRAIILVGNVVARYTSKKAATALLVLATASICFMYLDYPAAIRHHTLGHPEHNKKRKLKLEELAFIKSLELPKADNKYAVFNAHLSVQGNVPFMYYRDFAVAYREYPSREDVEKAVAMGLEVVVIELNTQLPQWMYHHPAIHVLKTG